MEHLGKQRDLEYINPSQIKLNDDKVENSIFRNARTTLNKEEMSTNRESIRKLGLLKPLIVRPLKNDPDGYLYQLVCGSRRLRNILRLRQEALNIVKEKRPFKPEELCFCPETAEWHPATEVYEGVKCFVRDCDDETAIAINIAENLEHSKVPEMDLMEFCQELVNIKDKNGKPRFSRSKVANMCNRSESWVSLTLELNQLPENIKEMMATDRVTRTAALAFLQTEKTKLSEVVKVASNIVKEKKLAEAEKAAEEVRLAQLDLADAQHDVTLHAMMDNANLRQMAERRETNTRKRVSSASEKHENALKEAMHPTLTADVINQANMIVPGAKKGKPKAIPPKDIKSIHTKLAAYKATKPHHVATCKVVNAFLEVILGHRVYTSIESLMEEGILLSKEDCVLEN